jgi:hypothetical protein
MFYYRQPVQATIDASTQTPLHTLHLGPKEPLPSDLFNKTLFETTLNSGSQLITERNNTLPGSTIPRYMDGLHATELSAFTGAEESRIEELPPMAAMAAVTSERPMMDYLDEKALAESYEMAYRLLFVRAMTDVLVTNFSSDTEEILGQRRVGSQSLVLEPLFTYLVEVQLGIVSLLAAILLYMNIVGRSQRKLLYDPGM